MPNALNYHAVHYRCEHMLQRIDGAIMLCKYIKDKEIWQQLYSLKQYFTELNHHAIIGLLNNKQLNPKSRTELLDKLEDVPADLLNWRKDATEMEELLN